MNSSIKEFYKSYTPLLSVFYFHKTLAYSPNPITDTLYRMKNNIIILLFNFIITLYLKRDRKYGP